LRPVLAKTSEILSQSTKAGHGVIPAIWGTINRRIEVEAGPGIKQTLSQK
jgi:hypothetical protein